MKGLQLQGRAIKRVLSCFFFFLFLAGCEWKEGGVLPSGWSSASLEGSCFPLTCVVSWEGCCVSSASGRAERHSHLQRGLGWRSGVHNRVLDSA